MSRLSWEYRFIFDAVSLVCDRQPANHIAPWLYNTCGYGRLDEVVTRVRRSGVKLIAKWILSGMAHIPNNLSHVSYKQPHAHHEINIMLFYVLNWTTAMIMMIPSCGLWPRHSHCCHSIGRWHIWCASTIFSAVYERIVRIQYDSPRDIRHLSMQYACWTWPSHSTQFSNLFFFSSIVHFIVQNSRVLIKNNYMFVGNCILRVDTAILRAMVLLWMWATLAVEQYRIEWNAITWVWDEVCSDIWKWEWHQSCDISCES